MLFQLQKIKKKLYNIYKNRFEKFEYSIDLMSVYIEKTKFPATFCAQCL